MRLSLADIERHRRRDLGTSGWATRRADWFGWEWCAYGPKGRSAKGTTLREGTAIDRAKRAMEALI